MLYLILKNLVQGFISKNVIQNTIVRIFNRKKPFIAILTTSIMFMTLHFQYGLMMMISAFILCIFLRYLYVKDDNIWGCSLVHFTVGFFPICFGLM